MHLVYVFHLSCLFQSFLLQSLLILKFKFSHKDLCTFLVMQLYSYKCTIENMLFYVHRQDNSMAMIWSLRFALGPLITVLNFSWIGVHV